MTKGSHGGMNKSGRVRALTPKVEGIPHTKPIPRIRNKILYIHRFVKGREAGQPRDSQRR